MKYIVIVLFALFLVIILFIRSPWGQNFIVEKTTSFVSNKTKTKVEIDNLYIIFDGDIKLKGLYLEDTKGDTLIYSKSLKADLPILPIIRGKGIGLESLKWKGLRANITRKDTISGYNFQFLIDAFATTDTLNTPEPEIKGDPLKIIVKDIFLKDFNVDFNDAVLGIESKIKLGKLNLEFDTFNLDTMDFRVSNAEVSQANINYIQSPTPPTTDTTTTILPYLSFNKFKIKDVKVHYVSIADNITLDTNISNFNVKEASLDLQRDKFYIDKIGLKNSEIGLFTTSNTTTKNTSNQNTATTTWPNLDVKINKVNFKNNTIKYAINNTKPIKNSFNANAIFLNNFNLDIKDLYLQNKTAGLDLKKITFNEASGLNLKHGELKFEATDKSINIKNINLALNKNKIEGNTHLEFSNISALANSPETSKLDLNLTTIQLDIKDVYRFQPELKNNVYLDSLSKKLITGQLFAKGYLSSISLKNTGLNWGKTTHISTSGLIENATNPDNLRFNVSNFKAETTKPDLLKFINETDLGVSLPETISILADLKGTINTIETTVKLRTSQGNANLNATYNNINEIAFTSNLSIEEYKLNELLLNEKLGPISLSVKASGNGKNINNLDAKLDAMLYNLNMKSYSIVNLPITGEIKNGKGQIKSTYKDKNINLNLQTQIVLDSISPQFIADLNIIGADLQALGMVEKDIRAALKLHANFKGNADNFDIESNISQGTIVYNNNTYLLGDLIANAQVNTDSTFVSVTNKLLNLELASNANPQTLSKALEEHISNYFHSDSTKIESKNSKPVILKLKGKLSADPILNNVFLPNLQNIDTVNITVDFNQTKKILDAKILAPYINYGGNKIDSLAFTFNSAPNTFKFDFGFKGIKAGPILLKRTEFKGKLLDQELSLNLSAFNGEEVLMQLNSIIKKEKDLFIFHILPEDFIINKSFWQVPYNNKIAYGSKNITFKNFNFKKENQSIIITSTAANSSTTKNISINFKGFNLNEFLTYLNPEKELAQGVLNGDFTVKNPFNNQGYIADLTINKFNILNTDFGILSLKGDSETNAKYNFSLATKEGDIDLNIIGDYETTQTNSSINVDLDINKFKTKALEGLSLGELTDASGYFTGHFKINGSINAPKYSGDLVFNKTRFKATKLNSYFELPNETLSIDNSGIRMSNFTVKDKNNNVLIFDGLVDTETLTNPKFNLKINAKNFQVLNATKKDNDMLYGFLAFKAEGTIKGNLNTPIINIKAGVNPKTNITYVIPSSSVNIEERDGVVRFVNRDNSNAILTRNQEQVSDVTGFNVSAKLSIPKEAKVTIVIDETSGDNFKTSGKGDFTFKMDTNGRMNLSGVYTVSSGHYEMNLYQLVNRKFELVPGSQVTWSGNPFDANLDVQALYKVETSASALMAAQISGSNSSTQNEFKQVLPFEVYLNIDNELVHPKISFNLDMPEEEQGAVSGQVYGRLQQVNQQEGELNRQVFSLLVMNRFYPDSGSDGSNGGFASIARDNLNDAISDQLNMFSDKLLGSSGIELGFDLNSFTDYSGDASKQRTQLEVAAQKKLFNDRVIVRVGSDVDIEGSSASGEETPIIGDVSLEYLITPSGKYRLKAFQKNEYESVIDGETTVSGIALIFTKEFNKFEELWISLINSDQEKTEAKRKLERKKDKNKQQKTTQ